MKHCKQEISLKKKDNRGILNGQVSDNLQTKMNHLSEDLCFLHVELMANLDYYNSIELGT